MIVNILKNLSYMTNISIELLQNLIRKIEYCICYDVEYCNKENSIQSISDLGFGKLIINILPDKNLEYKFIPSKEFEISLIEALNGSNLIEYNAEKSLKSKITSVYKEIM